MEKWVWPSELVMDLTTVLRLPSEHVMIMRRNLHAWKAKAYQACHPYGVGKLVQLCWGNQMLGYVHLCWVAGKTV